MSLTYDIEIRYLESGQLGQKIGDIGKKVKDVKGEFDGLGTAFSSGLSGAFDAVSDLAKGLSVATLAGVAGLAAMSGMVVHMNDQLEGTKIALASIFTSNGATSSFAAGLGVADAQILKMRKDAADLPGEFDDLINIFQTIAPNTFRGGFGVDQTRELAAQTMAAAAIMRLPMHVAAREMSGLIEGRAGAHNILGLRMMGLSGSKATEFNKLSEEDRLKRLKGEMSKLVSPDVLNAFQHSFTGLFSTAKQNFKTTAQVFGQPLFESVKGALEKVNNWYNENQTMIDAYAHHLGQKLADAFDYGISWFRQYGPVIWEVATNAAARIHDAFARMEPILARIGSHIKSFLSDPQAIDKLEHIAKIGLALRVGAPLAKSLLGFGFDATMAGGVGSGTGASSALAAATAAPEVAVTAAALVAVGVAAGGAALAISDAGSLVHDSSVAAWNATTTDLAKAGKSMENSLTSIGESFRGPLEIVGSVFLANLSNFAGHLAWASKFVEFFANGQLSLMNSIFYGNAAISSLKSNIAEQAPKKLKAFEWQGSDKLNPASNVPKSVTNIGKVEIIVQSNQDPSRIARRTVEELHKVKKNTRSGFIPKWVGGNS